MMIIPLVWLLCIRIVAMVSESVTMDDQHLQMHFCSWFTFHTITVNHARIVRTDIMQTPMQKQYGVCHLYITCNGPRQQRFADGAPGEKGPGDPGDAGAGSIITKIFPVSAWVRKPIFL